jgi:hypothetical protein
MTLALARRRTASLVVAFLMAFSVAAVQQTGIISVPGVSQPAPAHADDLGWINCVGGMAAQSGYALFS